MTLSDSIVRLTKKGIEEAQTPTKKGERKEYRFVDAHGSQCYKGLILRVTSDGLRSFYIAKQITENGTRKFYRDKLGDYPALHPDEAWKQAQVKLGELQKSGDPRPAEREEARLELTFGELFSLYMEQYAKSNIKTWIDLEKNYDRYFRARWHNVKVSSIKRMEVQNWVNSLADGVKERKKRKGDGKATKKRSFESFRAIIKWGRKKEIINLTSDPVAGIDLDKSKARERFLQPGDEYNRFMAAVEDEPNPVIQHFVKLCLLTGVRSSNIMEMRWDQINWALATWKIPDTKNDDPQTVSLTESAMALLKDIWDYGTSNEWVLPGDGVTGHLVEPKNGWKRILQRAGITDLHPHDLRHTVASYMAIQGVDSKIIGKALGHRSLQATARYAHLTLDPVRLALENAQAAMDDPSKLLGKNGGND